MAVINDFSAVEQDLYRVVATTVGEKMFGAALKELQRSKLGLRIQTTLQKLDAAEITECLVRTQREAFLAECEALGVDARAKHPKPVMLRSTIVRPLC